MVAQKMSESLGQPVVVENRAGADTMLGVRFVKSSPADGYTLLATSESVVALPFVKQDPGYELKDFAGIGVIARSPWLMLVGPGQPDRSVADFVARAKARPADMSFASGGVGTTPYLAEQMLLQRAGVQLLHVPYKGIAAAIPDVISGRVTMVFDATGSSSSKVRSGQLRALAVTSTVRNPALPDVPTVAEQGMPGFSSYATIGLFAPVATPREVVVRISGALQAAIASREIRERYLAEGSETVAGTPEEFDEYLRRQSVEFGKLTSDLALQKQ
ncbi:tripartite tricarboxylate transporter substrate-binding protein [Variovorax sp. Sphag1AA]|uniref:tripartite tricarboxylate transporter substrate-binding protein n=1 Tax=Variovorax sp. Sphag1AA TaxID=2587027 RepID=UPI0021A80AB2|nr:tripartite tricarboxylate transporter substrate-binding protein [Variovorax sp. Sphag1AA]